ncbi:MAG: hypothetical protein H9W82_12160 [Lactobacillus sp.]|nr:hypothetical protein [Lactobacillus sp.]
MAKRKNIRQQLRAELYRQHKAGQGRSRHADKQSNGGKPIYDKIYSDLSLKTHLSRIEQFSGWLKAEHPEVRDFAQITRDLAGEYLQKQVGDGKSAYTIGADMLAVNRVQIGSGCWDNAIKKSDYGLPQRSFATLRNNHGSVHRNEEQQQEDSRMRDRYSEVLFYGQAFGLRRSELVPSDSRQTVAGTGSLYERDNKLYHITTGKGGRLRAIECLKSHEPEIRETYGEHIKLMPDYLLKDSYTKVDIEQFKAEWKQGEQFFNSLDRSLRIHVECRQFYANHKLDEIQQGLFGDVRKYTVNGVAISQLEADHISKQLGHGGDRWDVLQRYIGR